MPSTGGRGLPPGAAPAYAAPAKMSRSTEKRGQPPARPDAAPPAAGSDVDEGLGIDAILDRLEQVVRDLEGGELPIERALDRFEQGVHLARKGNTLLDRVEQRVEMLLADRDETVPLNPGGGDEELP